ncbi:zinc-binding dehydrogenase [Lentzea albida]|uniref:NADPH:quinone reductase n=1 Tax=Lentzea albida TaxID=65499 RepID=A0A1H9V730_9PSEU|nr:zinc-binding dehydrogenase [Lentzea albida]SES17482.1 NADPH:quinone reductase [Lentzea albida]
MIGTMRAAVLEAPGPPENLVVRDLPVPDPPAGWVRVRVRAFGLNRSDLLSRRGFPGHAVSLPRVLGAEAVGEVDLDRSGRFARGQQVAAVLTGMGRQLDGGYAEYACVPMAGICPFRSKLNWAVLGAMPTMFQTAYESLVVAVDLRRGQTVLVRGGTSSVGLAAILLAKNLGATVLATTRDPEKVDLLRLHGVDHVVIDDGFVEPQVRALFPDGVDGAVELVGWSTLADTLRATSETGTVCLTGSLGDETGSSHAGPAVSRDGRLVLCHGDRKPGPQVLQRMIDEVEAGRLDVPVGRVYRIADIARAHRDMEANLICGKAVVVVE